MVKSKAWLIQLKGTAKVGKDAEDETNDKHNFPKCFPYFTHSSVLHKS